MPPRRRDQHTDGSRGPCLPSKVLVIQDPNRPPIRPDFFHPNARVIDDLDHFVCYSFRPKLAGECVLVAKLLVACDPAENGDPAGHPGFATDGAKAFCLGKPGADRYGNLKAIIRGPAALGLVIVMPANIPTGGVVLTRFRHCDLSCTITNVQPPPANGGLISISRGARSRRSGLTPPHGKNRRGLLNSTVAERRVTISNTEVAIIGGGAGGIAAGRR